jgi:hypothetical protein
VKVQPPPYPEYRTQGIGPTHHYRVVFWEHQLPPEGSDIPPEEMGWAELTIDLTEVEDVQGATPWAEGQIHARLDDLGAGSDTPHGERVYVLWAKVPNLELFIQIAGWDPTVTSPEWNLARRYPMP